MTLSLMPKRPFHYIHQSVYCNLVVIIHTHFSHGLSCQHYIPYQFQEVGAFGSLFYINQNLNGPYRDTDSDKQPLHMDILNDRNNFALTRNSFIY